MLDADRKPCALHLAAGSEIATHCLCDGEHFPTGRVDGNQARGEQLLILRAVAPAGVHYLINADLKPNNRDGLTITLKPEVCLAVCTCTSTNLAEMVPGECQCCLRPQLEKVQLRSEDLLCTRNGGQVESVLHLFTAHWNRKSHRYRPGETACVNVHV